MTAAPHDIQPDIVERLRDQGKDAFAKHYSLGMFKLCAEAADEIDHLRLSFKNALQELAVALSHGADTREAVWQDMATAPKDGTRILVWFKNPDQETRYMLVKWDAGLNGWRIGSKDGQSYVLSKKTPPEAWSAFTPPALSRSSTATEEPRR